MIGMIPRDQLFRSQNKYFALRILSRSRHNLVVIYFFVDKYILCSLFDMPNKRRLVKSKVCFDSEKAGLLDHSYNKCALENLNCQWLFLQFHADSKVTYLFGDWVNEPYVNVLFLTDTCKMNLQNICLSS